MATAPKSNSAHNAILAAEQDLRRGKTGPVPRQLQNKHFDGEDAAQKGQNYLYPHDYPGHWVKQQYLPDALAGVRYYEYGKQKRAGREGLLGQNQEVRARQAGAEAGRAPPAPAARAAGGRREQAREIRFLEKYNE